jgi:hypothetical protein
MEISAMQGEEVAAPGGVVSGAAGTGQEHENQAAPVTAGRCTQPGRHRGRIVIGLGVLAPEGPGGGPGPGEERPLTKDPEDPGRVDPDLAFALYERDERIAERLNRKIARLEKRLAMLEERGRS